MSIATALLTRGMICVPCKKANDLISFLTPEMTATLEVRPQIRGVIGPDDSSVDAPVVTSTQELRPTTNPQGLAPVLTIHKPENTSAQELKPIIKSVKED